MLNRPLPSPTTTQDDHPKVRPLKVDTSTVENKPPVKEVISSPERLGFNKPPASNGNTRSGSPRERSRPGPFHYPPRSNLKQVSPANHDPQPPVKEIIPSPVKDDQKVSLARRAFLTKHKHGGHSPGGNNTIDGTLTTSELTVSEVSPDKYSKASFMTQSEIARQVLKRSAEVAEAAHSVLSSSRAAESYHGPETIVNAASPSSLNVVPEKGLTVTAMAARKKTPDSGRSNYIDGISKKDTSKFTFRASSADNQLEQGRKRLNESIFPKKPEPSEKSHQPKKSQSEYGLGSSRNERPPSPRQLEMTARLMREDTLAASRRKAVLESKHRFVAQNRAETPPQDNRPGNPNEEGPLSARRMKIESSDTDTNDAAAMAESSQRARTPSPRRAMLARRTFREQDPGLARRRERKETYSGEQTQLTHSQRTSLRGNIISGEAFKYEDPMAANRRMVEDSALARDQMDDPLSASRMKIDASDVQVRNTSKPSPQQRTPSPRRFISSLPPSGRQSPRRAKTPEKLEPQLRSTTPVDKFYEEERSPPPPPAKEDQSPWRENKATPSGNQRRRPPPIQTGAVDRIEAHLQELETSQSPYRAHSGNPYPTTVHLNASPTPLVERQQVNSPAVERLSSILVETSSVAEISTLADLLRPIS